MKSKYLINYLRKWYKTIKSVYCPALKENVIFNSQGFRHLKYDGKGIARPTKDYHQRIKLLPLAIPVIKTSTNILSHERLYQGGHGKYTDYWSLRQLVGRGNISVTVILRKNGRWTNNILQYI